MRRSAAARLLRLWVRIPSGAWLCVCCECCMLLSGRCLCDGLITRPEESCNTVLCRLCVIKKNLLNEEAIARVGLQRQQKKIYILRVQKECLSEAKASHSHETWTEVSSSVPHFLQMGLSLSPITYKCLPRVLCPDRRPMTILDCVLLTH